MLKKYALLLSLSFLIVQGLQSQNTMNQTIYQFEMTDIDGNQVSLSDYKDKVVVIVNVASQCGLTPQYADLQELYASFKDKGLVILGFPANNFGAQEPGSDAEIKTFCTTNFEVSFPMFSKISVKGEDMHPLYQFLTQKSQNGILDTEVKWNFQKFIVNKQGALVQEVHPTTKVDDPEIVKMLEGLLAN